MTPGTLFFDNAFVFHDGGQAQKILVTLGSGQGITIVVKTTSQGRHYRNDYGCQVEHRFPNFYLPIGSCCLTKSTWICLDEFYEFKDTELLQRHFTGQVNRVGVLTDQITIELLECALLSPDISGRQSVIVKAALETFRNRPQEVQ